MVMGSSPGALIATQNTTTNVATGANAYLAANGLDESYSYDSFGNLQQSGNYSFIQAYSQDNRLSGWSYDASGNLVIDGNNNGYGYDAEGRVSGMGQYIVGSGGTYTFNPQYSYIYDADGQRVSKTGPGAADHIYFGGRELARLVGGQWTDLIYGASGLLAEVPGTQNGAPVYRMTDHLGTQVGTLSSTGLLLSATDYAPFGQVFSGGSTDPYKFTGKERDAESGLDYFGARYYGSNMGRFMSPDSSGYSGLTNPQSWNLYAYTLNNPLRYDDPTGHTVENACGDKAACTAAVGAATGSAEAASHVTSTTTTTDHSFLGIHWTTSTTTIGVSGIDMASFRGLSENANKLADLIESKQNFTVDINNSYLADDRQTTSGFMNHTVLNPDFTQTPSMTGNNDGNVYVRWNPGRYDQESRDENIPAANMGEAMAHELLGHLWGEVYGGHMAGTAANKQDAVHAENAVRKTDPSRGQKATHDHNQIQ